MVELTQQLNLVLVSIDISDHDLFDLLDGVVDLLILMRGQDDLSVGAGAQHSLKRVVLFDVFRLLENEVRLIDFKCRLTSH